MNTNLLSDHKELAEKLVLLIGNTVEHYVIPIIRENDRERKGGCFVAWRSDLAVRVLACGFGKISFERYERYMLFANEKVKRLNGRPGDISSWQSRNQEQMQYGGAIRCDDDLVLSFSGFPEEVDEAICLIAAKMLDLIDDDRIAQITQVHGSNWMYERYLSEKWVL